MRPSPSSADFLPTSIMPISASSLSADGSLPGASIYADRLAAGAAALEAIDGERARQAFQAAITFEPPAPEAYQGLATALDLLGQASDALACRMASLALQSGTALDIYNIGTAYLMAGHKPQAESWYRLALRVDPELVVAHRNLAALLRDTGRAEEAQRHTEAAYRRQYVFDTGPNGPSASGPAAPTVLLICAAGRGNVPVDLWFAPQTSRRIEYMIEYAPSSADAATIAAWPCSMPVFNAIGDPDVAGPLTARLLDFVACLKRPVLNSPEAVARTARDSLPALLGGIPDLLVPDVWRVERTRRDDLRRQLDGQTGAWLVRPVATHGGEGLVLADSSAAVFEHIERHAAGEFYVTRFCDFRSIDRFYRKYRMIFIDGRAYPYHLAISSTWLVHYFSADMLAHAWKQTEEARFLNDPRAVLGDRAMTALAAVGDRLGLDYAGIDFSQLPDGRIVVFEANATMLVHPEPEGSVLAYKNTQVEAMRDAFAAMLERRMQR